MKATRSFIYSVLFVLGVVSAQSDDELVITYAGQEGNNCNNPLDHARILVAASNFLTEMQDVAGTDKIAPKMGDGEAEKPKSKTCDSLFEPCNIAQGGGCCSNLKCSVTSNGLQRCVELDYQPICKENRGFCTRGQPCCNGLSCQDSTEYSGQKECLPTRRALRNSEPKEIAAPADTAEDKVGHISRKLYNRRWGCSGRTCRRCAPGIKKNYKYCASLCMFQCTGTRPRELIGNDMDKFLADLKTYITPMDFGDDCRVVDLDFTYYIGKPGKTTW